MVKEVRIGWDDEFGQPALNPPSRWDNDFDELVDDLKRTRPSPRSRKSTRRPPVSPNQSPSE